MMSNSNSARSRKILDGVKKLKSIDREIEKVERQAVLKTKQLNKQRSQLARVLDRDVKSLLRALAK